MKHGYVWKDEKTRWFEPDHLLLGQEYYLHAYGSIYALAKKTVQNVIIRNFSNLRYLSNEGEYKCRELPLWYDHQSYAFVILL